MRDTLSDPDLVKPTEGILPCLVCGKPVVKGEWWVMAIQAIETVQTGTPNSSGEHTANYVPQRPVHLLCVATPF